MKKLNKAVISRRSQACKILAIFVFFSIFCVLGTQKVEALDYSNYPEVQEVTSELKPEPKKAIEKVELRYELSDYERDLVERVIMSEAGGQPYKGQMAVAQCILNSAEAHDKSPADIVLAKNQYAAPSDKKVSAQVKRAVRAVFDEGKVAIDAKIRYFYAPKYCYSSWHESRPYAGTIGGHKFFE